MLLELKDGAVVDIKYDTDSQRGCETCDYGSWYVNEYEFIFDCGLKCDLKVGQMYEVPLSESFMMKFLVNNLDSFKETRKVDFKAKIKDMILKEVKDVKNNWRDSDYLKKHPYGDDIESVYDFNEDSIN